MDQDIVDLNPPEKEEPWCSFCSNFTDYKRKWSTFPRANLDGGTYPENIEVPHCMECGSAMYVLSSCRKLVWAMRITGLILMILSTLTCFFFYEFSLWTLVFWSFSIISSVFIIKVPVTARKALESYSLYLEKEKLLSANKSTS